MTERSVDRDESQAIRALAARAELIIDRRKFVKSAGRSLVLPALVSLLVTRDAMGRSGSNDSGSVGMGMMSGMMGMM